MKSGAAVLALVTRDLRALRRSRSQLYSSVLFPLMLLAVIGTGVSEGLQPANVDDYVTFLVPGIIVMTAFFSSTFSSASYYADRDSGMLRSFFVTPHSPRVILLAKLTSSLVIGMAQALVVLGVTAVLPAVDFRWQYGTPGSLALVLGAIVLLNLFLAGVGQWLARRIRTMQGFHLFMNLVLFPFLFFSGAFFPLDDLPAWLQALGRINPLAYAVDALQLALYAGSDDGYVGLPIDIAVMIALATGMLYLATARSTEPDR